MYIFDNRFLQYEYFDKISYFFIVDR